MSAYGFESDPDKRRRVLSMLFVAMKVEEPFALEDVFERVLQDSESLGLTTSRLSRYQSILWQSRCFIVEPEQQDRPVRQRLTRLQPQIVSDEDLIVRYESSVVYKLGVAATATGEELTASLVCRVLGLLETPDAIAARTPARAPLRGSATALEPPRLFRRPRWRVAGQEMQRQPALRRSDILAHPRRLVRRQTVEHQVHRAQAAARSSPMTSKVARTSGDGATHRVRYAS